MKAIDTQIGGSYYKDMPYQPIALIDKLELDYFSGNVLKYLCRYRQKGGINDLEKARHYCQLARDFNVIKPSPSILDTEEVEDFVRVNQIHEDVGDVILYDLLSGLWDDAIVNTSTSTSNDKRRTRRDERLCLHLKITA